MAFLFSFAMMSHLPVLTFHVRFIFRRLPYTTCSPCLPPMDTDIRVELEHLLQSLILHFCFGLSGGEYSVNPRDAMLA